MLFHSKHIISLDLSNFEGLKLGFCLSGCKFFLTPSFWMTECQSRVILINDLVVQKSGCDAPTL